MTDLGSEFTGQMVIAEREPKRGSEGKASSGVQGQMLLVRGSGSQSPDEAKRLFALSRLEESANLFQNPLQNKNFVGRLRGMAHTGPLGSAIASCRVCIHMTQC